jgi:hypothetical protein
VPALHPPVEAPIVRPFSFGGSPFAGGHHRGADLAAASGEVVLAPCTGRVAFAGPTPAGPAVTLECDGRRLRVTLLPVRARRARAGRPVRAGDVVGTVGRGARGADATGAAASPDGGRAHAGLHLGVRRAGNPFGYVDPAPLLAAAPPPLGPAPPPSRRPARPPARRPPGRAGRSTPNASPPPARAPAPVGAGVRPSEPATVPLGAGIPPSPPATVPADPTATMAPWPVWAGLALVLLGAAGTAGRGRRRAARSAPRPALVRRE